MQYLKVFVQNEVKNSDKHSDKMQGLNYKNARIYKGSGVWFLEWYNEDPKTKSLARVRKSFDLNRIKDIKQRESVAGFICTTINHLLGNGYNHFVHNFANFKSELELKEKKKIEATQKTSIADALQFSLNIHKKRLRTARSVGSYKSACAVFVADLLKNKIDVSVQDFTAKMAMEYIQRRINSGISPNTMNCQKDFLNTLFEVLKSAEMIVQNPFSKVQNAAEIETKHHEALTVAELKLISETLPQKNIYYYVFLMHIYYATMRPTHIGGLCGRHYDFENNLLHITPETSKNQKSKSKQMLSPLRVALLSIGADTLGKDVFLFGLGFKPGAKRNMNITQRSNELWNKYVVQDLGIKKTPYGLKHTFGQNYLQFNNADADWLQRQMEHANLQQTNAYIEDRGVKILDEKNIVLPKF